MRWSLFWSLCLLGVVACEGSPSGDPSPELLDGGPVGDGDLPIWVDTGLGVDGSVATDPRLNSVIPGRGPVSGGTRLRIVGAEFVEGMVVSLGASACLDLVVESENHLRCTAPAAEVVGPVDVLVRWPGDGEPAALVKGFQYFEPVGLTAVDPPRGPVRGGVSVTLTGKGFEEPTSVRFGANSAGRAVVESAERLTVTLPAGTPGPVDVVVRNVNGEAVLADAFTYTEALTLTGVEPPWGYVDGGERVALRGTGLLGGSEVRLGAAAEVVSSELERTRLAVNTPAGAPGLVDVVVENGNGQATLPDGFLFLPRGAGALTLLGAVPRRLSTEGGETFVVGGQGFSAESQVKVDGQRVACTFEAGERLSCVAPPHAAGPASLEVTDGAAQARLGDALLFVQTVELYDVRPPRGSVAGGAVVEVLGRGFKEGLALSFDGVPLAQVQVVSEGRALARTPPGHAGWVSLEATAGEATSVLPDAFRYFSPYTRYGGLWGEPIERAVNVAVYDSATNEPLPGASVVVLGLSGTPRVDATTDEAGLATASVEALSGPVSVTAGAPGYEIATFERVMAENVTFFLYPHNPPEPPPEEGDPDGGGEDPPWNGTMTGEVTGLAALPKPLEPGLVLAAFVETTHSSMFNRRGLPPPEPNGILFEDGAFEVACRPGQLAVVVTAGYVQASLLDEYLNTGYDYWGMRETVTPIALGVQRYLSVSPGASVDGLTIELDIPMDLDVPITLDNPSAVVEGGPSVYAVAGYLDFGAEGVLEIDSRAEGPSPKLQLAHLPDVEARFEPDVELFLVGKAHAEGYEWAQPYAIAFERTRAVRSEVLVGPFVGTVSFIVPIEGGNLGAERRFAWTVHPGVDGPTEPPDVNYLTLRSAEGLPLWTYVSPGTVTEYRLPELPEGVLSQALLEGQLYLTLTSVLSDRPLNYDRFTFGDLSYFDRTSFSVNSVSFLP